MANLNRQLPACIAGWLLASVLDFVAEGIIRVKFTFQSRISDHYGPESSDSTYSKLQPLAPGTSGGV